MGALGNARQNPQHLGVDLPRVRLAGDRVALVEPDFLGDELLQPADFGVVAVEKLQEADAGKGTCRSRLSQVALAYATIILESENLLQTLLRDAAHFDPEDIVRLLPELSSQIPAVISKILEDGIAAGELRAVAPHRTGILLMGMVNAMAVRRLYAEVNTTLEEDTDLVIDILFQGICA
mgnify:CR=1 FL=1